MAETGKFFGLTHKGKDTGIIIKSDESWRGTHHAGHYADAHFPEGNPIVGKTQPSPELALEGIIANIAKVMAVETGLPQEILANTIKLTPILKEKVSIHPTSGALIIE